MKNYILSIFVLLTLASSASAQQKPIAFVGARIIPIVGEPIENGILLVQNGKIMAGGDARSVRLSLDVQIFDVQGKTIMPGLV